MKGFDMKNIKIAMHVLLTPLVFANITLKAAPVHVDNPPVCMESLQYGKQDGLGSACLNAKGIFNGGLGCREILKLRNLSDANISQSSIHVDFKNKFIGKVVNSCGIDGTDQTGHDCNVNISSPSANYDPLGAFGAYDSHSVYIGVSAAVAGGGPFDDSNITINYEENGEAYTGTLKKCQIEPEPADDMCYESRVTIKKGFGICMDFGFMSFGAATGGCGKEIVLRNVGDDKLIQPVVSIITKSLFKGQMMDECGINGTEGNCGQDDVVSAPLMGMSGMFMGSGITYDPISDFDSNETHSIYSLSKINAKGFPQTKLMGQYIKDGKLYYGEIHACGPREGYVDGPFDAWDTFRDDPDAPPADRAISTKVVNIPFKLSLASLNRDSDKYEKKNGESGAIVHVGIYPYGSLLPVSNTVSFDPLSHKHVAQSNTLTVTHAAHHAKVGFKFCATYIDDDDTGKYKLYRDSQCTDPAIQPCGSVTEKDKPTWHLCYASDELAIRPDHYTVAMPDPDAPDLLRSGKAYRIALTAIDANSTTPSADYNVSNLAPSLGIKTTKYFKNGSIDTHGLLHGTAEVNSSVHIYSVGGMTSPDENKPSSAQPVVPILYNDIGRVMLRIYDYTWSNVDQNDTPQNCDGGTINGVKVPGAYICGDLNLTFIPDHFKVENIHLHNHHDGNFTYLSSDLNMSAHVDLNISARNARGEVVQNFRRGSLYYENPVQVDMNVTEWIGNGTPASRHPGGVKALVHDIHTARLLGFGGADANGTHHIAWNESNASQQLMLNYPRKKNRPVNPFVLNGSDINITVQSYYGNTIISGTGIADQNATFLYARAKATKDLYDDVTDGHKNTPIMVEVYCDKWPASAAICPQVDTLSGQTHDRRWFLATSHDMSRDNGNITLSANHGAQITHPSVSIQSADKGVDLLEDVTCSSSGLVDINFVTTHPTDTSSWLIFNKDSDTIPVPFYQVRCIGTGSWSGAGKTGHVVDGRINTKKSRQVEW